MEDLRNGIHPVRVLHAAVRLAKIADTGAILPLLSDLSPAQEEQVRNAVVAPQAANV